MTTDQKRARWFGVLYLITFLTSIPAALLYRPLLDDPVALGVIGAMIFAAIEGKLSWRMLNASAEATARNTAMIGAILFGAYVLNFIFVSLGVPQQLAQLVSAMPLPPRCCSPWK